MVTSRPSTSFIVVLKSSVWRAAVFAGGVCACACGSDIDSGASASQVTKEASNAVAQPSTAWEMMDFFMVSSLREMISEYVAPETGGLDGRAPGAPSFVRVFGQREINMIAR